MTMTRQEFLQTAENRKRIDKLLSESTRMVIQHFRSRGHDVHAWKALGHGAQDRTRVFLQVAGHDPVHVDIDMLKAVLDPETTVAEALVDLTKKAYSLLGDECGESGRAAVLAMATGGQWSPTPVGDVVFTKLVSGSEAPVVSPSVPPGVYALVQIRGGVAPRLGAMMVTVAGDVDVAHEFGEDPHKDSG